MRPFITIVILLIVSAIAAVLVGSVIALLADQTVLTGTLEVLAFEAVVLGILVWRETRNPSAFD